MVRSVTISCWDSAVQKRPRAFAESRRLPFAEDKPRQLWEVDWDDLVSLLKNSPELYMRMSKGLADPDPDHRWLVAEAFARLAPAMDIWAAVPALTNAIVSDPNRDVRRSAVTALRNAVWSTDVSYAVNAFAIVISDPDVLIRQPAVQAMKIMEINPETRPETRRIIASKMRCFNYSASFNEQAA